MSNENEPNSRNLKDDELKEVAGGNLMPIDPSGLIGGPLDIKLDPQVIPADPTHQFDPEIGFNTGSEKEGRELKRCLECYWGLIHVVLYENDKQPAYCPRCGAELHAQVFSSWH